MYMMLMGLMFGQSLMVTSVIVIVLHAKTSPYFKEWHKVITVSMETKQGMKNLTRDCTFRHETQPLCKV